MAYNWVIVLSSGQILQMLRDWCFCGLWKRKWLWVSVREGEKRCKACPYLMGQALPLSLHIQFLLPLYCQFLFIGNNNQCLSGVMVVFSN